MVSMKILVTKLHGDASVSFFNKQGELVHTEGFAGKVTDGGGYIRNVPVDFVEYSHAVSLSSGVFEYVVNA